MSTRLATTALLAAALVVTSWAVARQNPPPKDPPAERRDPFAQQPPDRGDRGGGGFQFRQVAMPGRYTVTTAGTTPLLLDTATGDTWLLTGRKDEDLAWKLVRREPVPAPKDALPPPKDRPGK